MNTSHFDIQRAVNVLINMGWPESRIIEALGEEARQFLPKQVSIQVELIEQEMHSRLVGTFRMNLQ